MIQVEVKPEAVSQVRRLIAGQKPEVAVRVYAQPGGGGCCGGGGGAVQFGMAFAKPRADDEVVKVDGFSVIVDPMSLPQVEGAKIDFVQSLDATGFTISSPNLPDASKAPAGSGCGCGSGGCGSGGGGGCC